MTSRQCQITPSPELRYQWQSESPFKVISVEREDYMIDRAARWGADQELEACCEYFGEDYFVQNKLRAARRPKPPSLAEKALIGLEMIDECAIDQMRNYTVFYELLTHRGTIRRALERLQELEGGQ